jgi:hypothetical protein
MSGAQTSSIPRIRIDFLQVRASLDSDCSEKFQQPPVSSAGSLAMRMQGAVTFSGGREAGKRKAT